MITLKETDLTSWGKIDNEELYEIFIDAENLVFKSKSDQQQFFEIKNTLLLLLRSKHHLEEAHMALLELVLFHYHEHSGFPKNSLSKTHYAFLSYVSTLICSCFNQSAYFEDKVPLQFILEEVKNNPTFKEIKSIRDKRFSHQDRKHHVHRDHLNWRFEKDNTNAFMPTSPSYTYENIHSLHRSQLNEWINFTLSLIQKINERVDIITKEINPLLTKISIPENNG